MTSGIEGQEHSGVSVETPKQATNIKKIFLLGFFGILGVIIVASGGIGIYRVYAKTSTDGFTTTVARVLRLPIAKVNGQVIYYSDYVDDLNAIRAMREYDKANGGPAASLDDAVLSDQVFFRQVNNILIADLARRNGITVSNSDVSDVKKNILEQQFGSLDKAAEEIKKRYGWTLEQFETKVIRQFVLQNKLAEKVTGDNAAKDLIQKQAQSVLDQIKNGADFAQMAAKYGSDGTAQKGGDLGWFGKGDMVPQFEAAAFGLKKGELDPKLVETQFGYHIVQTLDKKTEKEKDSKGKTVNVEKVQARHILFAFPTLDRLLSNELKGIKDSIRVYGKISNPFKVVDERTGNEQ